MWLGRKGLLSSCRGNLNPPAHNAQSPVFHCTSPDPLSSLTPSVPWAQLQGWMCVCPQLYPVLLLFSSCAHHPAISSGAALEGQEPGSFPGAGVSFKTHVMGTGFIGLFRDGKLPGCHSAVPDSEGGEALATAPLWAYQNEHGGEPRTLWTYGCRAAT